MAELLLVKLAWPVYYKTSSADDHASTTKTRLHGRWFSAHEIKPGSNFAWHSATGRNGYL